jgi:alpha-glucoside transport system substrate-binding protein
MVADGRTPWCVGFKRSGPDDGSPGTKWIDALVLRLGGVDFYDKWVARQVRFTDPVVRQAMEHFGQIAFTPGFVLGGPASISQTSDASGVGSLLADPPACLMRLANPFDPFFLADRGNVYEGVDIGSFELPPIAPGQPTPVPVEGETAAAVSDRPEVREFMRRLVDADWGTQMANRPHSPFHPANLVFNADRCRVPTLDERTNVLRVQLCRAVHDALATGQLRWEASDLMPPEVGGVAANGYRGTFFQGMLDYVDKGPGNLDAVLAAIDSSWP